MPISFSFDCVPQSFLSHIHFLTTLQPVACNFDRRLMIAIVLGQLTIPSITDALEDRSDCWKERNAQLFVRITTSLDQSPRDLTIVPWHACDEQRRQRSKLSRPIGETGSSPGHLGVDKLSIRVGTSSGWRKPGAALFHFPIRDGTNSPMQSLRYAQF